MESLTLVFESCNMILTRANEMPSIDDLAATAGRLTRFMSDTSGQVLGQLEEFGGDIADVFNGDAATVKGVEARFLTDLAPNGHYALPLSLTYTYIDGRFDTDIADTDFFGNVSVGDPIPYVPEHQLHGTLGVEWQDWRASLGVNYIDEVCTRVSE